MSDSYRRIWQWNLAKTIAVLLLLLISIFAWWKYHHVKDADGKLVSCCQTKPPPPPVCPGPNCPWTCPGPTCPWQVCESPKACLEKPPDTDRRTINHYTLGEAAFFNVGKSELRPEGKAILRAMVVPTLVDAARGKSTVTATGFADRLGRPGYDNDKLSERRAEEVVQFLKESVGTSDVSFAKPVGLGNKNPLPGTDCRTGTLKQQIRCLQPNRRVELKVESETVAGGKITDAVKK
jgi:outer membrane protein OmpA-like peptidoglycan-associated protein